MTKIQNGEFGEIEYTGRLEDGTIFDTTDEKVAKQNELHNEKTVYGSVIICIGQHHVLKGLDDAIEGKEVGTKFETKVAPENGFGKKNAKLLQMIPGHIFKRDKVVPMKGMPVNIDNNYGTIISVSGGRVIVDFNHPLSGKTLIYEIKVNRLVERDEDKLRAIVKLKIGADIKVKFDDTTKTATIEVEQIPKEIQEIVKKNFIEMIPSIKDIKFEKEKTETKAEKKPEAKDNKINKEEKAEHKTETKTEEKKESKKGESKPSKK